MSDELDYLLGGVEEEKELKFKKADLTELSGLMSQRDELAGEIEELDTKKKEKEGQLRNIDQLLIPGYLRDCGLSEIRLQDGRKVGYKDELSVTLNKAEEAAFFEFLDKRGDTDIVKLNLAFPRLDPAIHDKLLAAIAEVGVPSYDKKESVHASTLKKYAKDLLGVGKTPAQIAKGLENGTLVGEDKLTGFLKLYHYANTTIKK